jgi:hypothetical protein
MCIERKDRLGRKPLLKASMHIHHCVTSLEVCTKRHFCKHYLKGPFYAKSRVLDIRQTAEKNIFCRKQILVS